jgi:hypothetical protein
MRPLFSRSSLPQNQSSQYLSSIVSIIQTIFSVFVSRAERTYRVSFMRIDMSTGSSISPHICVNASPQVLATETPTSGY